MHRQRHDIGTSDWACSSLNPIINASQEDAHLSLMLT